MNATVSSTSSDRPSLWIVSPYADDGIYLHIKKKERILILLAGILAGVYIFNFFACVLW